MIKKAILFAHRWLGLISGLVVLILSVTGVLFVFQYEFTDYFRKELKYLEEVHEQRLPLRELTDVAVDGFGTGPLYSGIVTYRDPAQSWSAFQYKAQKSWSYFGSIQEYRSMYLNQYSGEVIGIVDEEKDFFQIVKGIHWSLLLATPIGQPIVVWSTVIFLVLLITGAVLWWPKKWNKKHLKKSLTLDFGLKWKRINYDLHNVLGFWSLLLAFVIGFTGLYWMFPFAKKTLYFIGTGEYRLPDAQTEVPISSMPTEILTIDFTGENDPLEIAYRQAWAEYPDAHSISFQLPDSSDSGGVITSTIRADNDTYYERSMMYFNQFTGEVVANFPYGDKNPGEKLLAMNYDLHVGAIGGIWGKILAAIASLICASLPITGFIIWWNKR